MTPDLNEILPEEVNQPEACAYDSPGEKYISPLENAKKNVENYIEVFNKVIVGEIDNDIERIKLSQERSMVVTIQELVKQNQPWYKEIYVLGRG